jgi:V/A-type H+-transporting ATPase subunit C
MASALTKYGFINAKLRARLSKIFSDDLYNQLIHARSLVEAIQFFQNTDFSFIEEIYTKTGDLMSIELELFNREVQFYVEVERFVNKGVLKFVEALAMSFEIENLKNCLRLWFDRSIRKRDISLPALYLYRGTIHYDLKPDKIIGAESLDEIARILKKTPYSDIILQSKDWILKKNSIFLAEVLFDQYFYDNLLEQINNLSGRDFDIAKKFIGVEIDLQNVNWLIRFKSLYNLPIEEAMQYILPSDFIGKNGANETIETIYKSGSIQDILKTFLKKSYKRFLPLLAGGSPDMTSKFALIEQILENIMMFEVSSVMRGYPFTIGIILAYFILKKNEIKRIMTILNAKYYGIQEDRLKNRI